jgi:GABA(A) receptor-associated protein
MWKFLAGSPTVNKTGYIFKLEHSFEVRKKEADRIRHKYPTKVPIIIEKSTNSQLQDLNNNKHIINESITIGQILYFIRKKISIDSSQSIFLFINNIHIPMTSDTIGKVYNQYKDDDNFLYITYAPENTFG